MSAHRISLLSAGLLTFAAIAHAEAPPSFKTMWGGFQTLRSVAAEPTGTVLAIDYYNGLRRYTSDGVFVQLVAPPGSGLDRPDPTDIAVAPTGEIYLLERDPQGIEHVVKLSSSGVPITQWGGHGTGPGQFIIPFGMATDAAGMVYVADTGNGRIEVFDSGGGFITQWPTHVSYHNPFDLVVSGGIVYVAVGNPGFVEMYTTSGAFLGEWSITLPDETVNSQPDGIALDAAGALYVGDAWNMRVKKFTTGGVLLSYWNGNSQPGGAFQVVTHIDVDLQGSIYVCDADRIQKYGYTLTPTRTTSWGRLKSAYR